MSLITRTTIAAFDLTKIQRGDCIRVLRTGDTTARNGFVTEASAEKLMVLYCNVQNNANSYLDIYAADVANGAWAIDWTRDFQTVSHEPEPDTDPEGADGS